MRARWPLPVRALEGHGVGVVLDDVGEAGRRRDWLPVIGHAFDEQGERLSCPLDGLVEVVRGNDCAGKSGNDTPKPASSLWIRAM